MNKNINLQWLDDEKKISESEISSLEDTVGVAFPQKYKIIIRNHDGCTPVKSDFSYLDVLSQSRMSGIGAFISIVTDEYLSMLDTFQDPPEFFPTGIVAFAEVGNGDLICFDYRVDPKTDNPPIVYWNHEAEEGKDVSFIAKDFEEFLSILKEPEDL